METVDFAMTVVIVVAVVWTIAGIIYDKKGDDDGILSR